MDERKAFLLRISPRLFDELSRWAHDDMRSLNGQLEYLLAEAVRRRKGGGKTSPAERSIQLFAVRAGRRAAQPGKV